MSSTSSDSPPRRIVVLLDGTWQKLSNRTNVALFDDNIEEGWIAVDRKEQKTRYFRGVGTSTSMVKNLVDGAFGYGLSKTIKDSFMWLSQNYRRGDEIFVFGFSRGAYSARSLVGLMHKVGGVLRAATPDLVEEAYRLYRDANSDATSFREHVNTEARVKMIGVWDTVGSLGIPVSGLPWVFPGIRASYRFHNTNLSCIVDEAYQALAIDEYRADFKPTLWDQKTGMNVKVEQCWFVGDHADIGGGHKNSTLSQIPYVWMKIKAEGAGLKFKDTLRGGAGGERQEGEEWRERGLWRQKPYDSFTWFLFGLYWIYRLGRRYFRVLGKTVEEVLHPSVLQRVDQIPGYQPKPLTNAGIPPGTQLQALLRTPVVQRCSCGAQATVTS